MEIRRLAPNDAASYRARRMRETRAKNGHKGTAEGLRSFGIEPRALKVDGRAFGKNHMFLEFDPL